MKVILSFLFFSDIQSSTSNSLQSYLAFNNSALVFINLWDPIFECDDWLIFININLGNHLSNPECLNFVLHWLFYCSFFSGSCKFYMPSLCWTKFEAIIYGYFYCCHSCVWGCAVCASCWGFPGQPFYIFTSDEFTVIIFISNEHNTFLNVHFFYGKGTADIQRELLLQGTVSDYSGEIYNISDVGVTCYAGSYQELENHRTGFNSNTFSSSWIMVYR